MNYTAPWLHMKLAATLSTDTSSESSNLSGDKASWDMRVALVRYTPGQFAKT